MSTDLFDDADAMLEVSQLVYALANIQKSKKTVVNPEFLDSFPKTSHEVVEWVNTNKDALVMGDFDVALLDDILERDQLDHSKDATLEAFDDDFAWAGADSEVVYGISKNPDLKRITVVFRGSQTISDWFANLNFRGTDVELDTETFKDVIPNVNTELLSEFSKVRVHRGFVQYLFDSPGEDEKGNAREPKFHAIIGHIMRLLKENPDYELWFSGHSLGGALAILAASVTALSNDVKKPIKLVTFASPQVGKDVFVANIDKAESSNILLHLRITNYDDLVPQLLGMFGYKHSGLHLNLLEKSHTLSFDQGGMKLPWFWQIRNRHNLEVYYGRLLKAKDALEKYKLDTVFETLRKT